jgi:hypothetical protein
VSGAAAAVAAHTVNNDGDESMGGESAAARPLEAESSGAQPATPGNISRADELYHLRFGKQDEPSGAHPAPAAAPAAAAAPAPDGESSRAHLGAASGGESTGDRAARAHEAESSGGGSGGSGGGGGGKPSKVELDEAGELSRTSTRPALTLLLLLLLLVYVCALTLNVRRSRWRRKQE